MKQWIRRTLGSAGPSLAVVLVGMEAGLGKVKGVSQRGSSIIKSIAGVVLIAAGFYLLATL